MATASTIYGKCELAKCNISSSLDYSSFYNEQLIFEVYQAMEGLNEIYNFYHNYFIIDICGCAYDKNDELFEICKQQELPNSLNNTADLIDYILNINDLISKLVIVYLFILLIILKILLALLLFLLFGRKLLSLFNSCY